MIVYFDTSALLKRYVAEAGTDVIVALWERASVIATSQILYSEVVAAIARKRREDSSSAETLDQALGLFRMDWNELHRVSIDDNLNRRVEELVSHYPLRSADAIHLASALALRDLTQGDLTFACTDKALVAAARSEGLQTSP